MSFKNSILKLVYTLLFVFQLCYVGSSQILQVSYQMEYDEDNCKYQAYLIIDQGMTTSLFQQIQSNAQMTVVTPKSSTLVMGSNYNPTRLNSSIPLNWVASNSDLVGDPEHNYYGITPQLSPTAAFEPLQAGDKILLYDFTVTPAVHGPDGVRFYLNGVDMNQFTGLSGDFSNAYTIGGTNPLFNDIVPQVYPTTYAENLGPSTLSINNTTTIAPTSNGTWVNNDPSVVSVSAGVVTGMGEGDAVLDYMPTNGGCTSSIPIKVTPYVNPYNVGIGTTEPHPSAILDIVSTEKGVLLPRMTGSQRIAIGSPAAGLIVYQTDLNSGIYLFDGVDWNLLSHVIDPLAFSGPTGGTSNKTTDTRLTQAIELQEELEQRLRDQQKMINELTTQISE